jgi:hypothetical protein
MDRLTLYGAGVAVAGIAIVLAKASMTGNVTGAALQAVNAFDLLGSFLVVAGFGMIFASYLWKPKE